MADKIQAIKYMMSIEGDEWELSPKDNGTWTGGEVDLGENIGTKFGITAQDLAKILGRTPTIDDMKNLTIDKVVSFLEPTYLIPIRITEIKSQDKANKLAESGYNGGVKTAIGMIQEALGVPITRKMDDITLTALNNLS